jgi:outer membrane lipoprotein SlyB
MADEQITTSIDYTSRDYYSLRNDLITRVKARVAENGKVWSGTDPADFGVAIVEAFAHVGDVTNYYVDRMANEAYLSTATQRQSLLNLAKMYGYQVSGYQQALVDVTITNTTATGITVPSGTVFSVSIVITTNGNSKTIVEYFSTEEEVVLEGNASETVTLVHGRKVSGFAGNGVDANDSNDIAGESLGYSTGFGNQTFKLQYNQVVEDSLEVYVRNGNAFVLWQKVDDLLGFGPQDRVYATSSDGNNYVYVNFGDGVSGAVPVYGEEIKAEYYVGGGINGNISGGKTFVVESVPSGSEITKAELLPSITVTNAGSEPGFGGEDPESNESIRKNASSAFRTATRAVSLNDFEQFAITTSGVGKAAAYASAPTSVNLYVGPIVSDSSSDYYPGFDVTNTSTTTSWQSLKDAVTTEFGDKIQIGTTLTILPPIYVPVQVAVEYVAEEGYTDAQLTAAVNAGVVLGYGYNALDFKLPIRPEKLERSLGIIEGIDSVKVLKLYRDGGSAARTTLIPAQGEYFVFKDSNTAIYPAASLAGLTVTISNGTMPSFTTLTKTYSFTSTSTSFTATPTSANTLSGLAAVLTYTYTQANGTVTTGSLTSGSASGSYTLSTGLNTLAVHVASADGLNTNTYYIKVTK